MIDELVGFRVDCGILAVSSREPLPSLEGFLKAMPKRALVPVLCGINDKSHMGAIFRNAALFAADGVILDKMTFDPLDHDTMKLSCGASLKLPFTRGEDKKTIMGDLSRAGFQIYAITSHASIYLHEVQLGARSALLFGPGIIEDIQAVHSLRIPVAFNFDNISIDSIAGICFSYFSDHSRLN